MKLISFSDLRQMLGGRGRTSIYRDIEQDRLPRPIKFGARCYWRLEDINAAIARAEQKTTSHSTSDASHASKSKGGPC